MTGLIITYLAHSLMRQTGAIQPRRKSNDMIISGLAEILGDEEDFDGLISAIEDIDDLIPAD